MTRKIRAALAIAAMVPGLAVAAPAPRDFAVADKPALGDVYPDRVMHFPGGVTGLADVTYSVLDSYRPMIMDIYLPAKGKTAKARPLVLYIHGGGWFQGHTRQAAAFANFPAVLARLASEGFVVASVEYRLTGEAPFPAQLQDVRAALRFLKANAAKYGIDPTRTGVWGGSAGGHLAALTALSCGETGLDPKPAPAGSECVQAAVTWYGLFDFAPMVAQAGPANMPARALLDCKDSQCTPDMIRRASPISYADAKDPPILLIHGEDDKVALPEQSHRLEARLRAVGAPVTAIYISGVGHSWIGPNPAATRAATLKAANATFDFFNAQLKP